MSAASTANLPEVTGELRDSYGYTWALQGTFGTRSALKRRAARAERSLLRNTEPWVALAERARPTNRAALMHDTWKTLLQCQPHDTLCGCSVDAVARAMSARLDEVEVQAAGLREDALFDLIGYDAIATRAAQGAWHSSVVVCNPSARVRGGVAEVEVHMVRDHVRVGPGSGGAVAMPIGEPSPDWVLERNTIPVQRLTSTRKHVRLESPQHYPWDDYVESTAALIWVPPVAGYGTRAFALAKGESAPTAAPQEVRASGRSMENDALRVEVDERGAVTLTTLDGSHAIASLLSIEAMVDAGDLYTPSLRGELAFAELSSPRAGLRGPLRGTITIPWRVESRADIRLQKPDSASGTITLALDAGAPHLGIQVRGENALRNHRVRLRIATHVANADVFADAAFGPVRREPIVAPPGTAETPPPTAPLARYVTLASPSTGATIISDGLGEYEALADGTVAITLFRAVGELSRNDLPERPGHAGWPAPTPEAQEQGEFAACFALLPHGPRNEAAIAEIERTADDVLHPLAGRTVRSATDLPIATAGVTLEGEGLALSTIKTSQDGAWLVLRMRESHGARDRRRMVSRLSRHPSACVAPRRDGGRISWNSRQSRAVRGRAPCDRHSARALGTRAHRLQFVPRESVAQRIAEQRAREHRENEREPRRECDPRCQHDQLAAIRDHVPPNWVTAAGCPIRERRARSRAAPRCRRPARSPRWPERARSAGRVATARARAKRPWPARSR